MDHDLTFCPTSHLILILPPLFLPTTGKLDSTPSFISDPQIGQLPQKCYLFQNLHCLDQNTSLMKRGCLKGGGWNWLAGASCVQCPLRKHSSIAVRRSKEPLHQMTDLYRYHYKRNSAKSHFCHRGGLRERNPLPPQRRKLNPRSKWKMVLLTIWEGLSWDQIPHHASLLAYKVVRQQATKDADITIQTDVRPTYTLRRICSTRGFGCRQLHSVGWEMAFWG